uniref:Phosphodiesterase I n=2 Tax=Macrostomum lignano TaxID=282301 RepID=A0A1I8I3F0_9PLAT
MTSSPQQAQQVPNNLAATTPIGDGDPTDVTDAQSCLSYLKSREVFLYKMMGDPAHRSMLYFLEVLMNVDSPDGVRLTSLSQHFHSRHFTQDMREAVASAGGLKPFLQKYPSLFRVNGESVSAVSLDGALSQISGDTAATAASSSSSSSTMAAAAAQAAAAAAAASSSGSGRSQHHNGGRRDSIGSNNSARSGSDAAAALHSVSGDPNDFARETEAVRFFQTRLSRREDRWVPIKSLAGHLSQAPPEIRAVVGPQAEFARFLARHRHVFELQGELSLPTTPTSTAGPGGSSGGGLSSSISGGAGPVSMTAAEYKTVMFLRKVLERKGGLLSIPQLFSVLSRSGEGAEQARNLIGWTQIELEEFLRKQSLFFDIHPADGSVSCRRAQKLNIIITGGRRSNRDGKSGAGGGSAGVDQTAPRTLTNRRGRVFHCARLWGIIDLGRHEHVFFDKSIFKHVDDLQKHFKVCSGGIGDPNLAGVPDEGAKVTDIVRGGQLVHPLGVAEVFVPRLVEVRAEGDVMLRGLLSYATERTVINIHLEQVLGALLNGANFCLENRGVLTEVQTFLEEHLTLMNEILYFNAILAPKESRAKWRATQVWKEADRAVMERLSGGALTAAASAVKSPLGPEPLDSLELADDIKFLSDIDETELRRVLQDDADSRTSSSVPSPVLTPDLSEGKDEPPPPPPHQQPPQPTPSRSTSGGCCSRCQAPTTPAACNGGRK